MRAGRSWPSRIPAFELWPDDRAGKRFCIWHPVRAAIPRGLVVGLHAFGEEMNKSRRMSALAARAMASSGFAVLQFDALGCGDSEGEFRDALWGAWADDALHACDRALARWVQDGHAAPDECWLWGHRAGCLLVPTVLDRLTSGSWNALLWQPVLSGQTVMQHMFRLDAAADLLGRGSARDRPKAKDALAQQQIVEIAGYEVSPALAAGLGAARLTAPAKPAHGVWLDVAASPDPEPSPATSRALDGWRQAGWQLNHRMVRGPSFWQTTEIEDAPALIDATVSALIRHAVERAGGGVTAAS